MLCEKRARKVHQIGDDAVVCVRPEAGKFKAVAGLLLLLSVASRFLYRAPARAVGIILGVCAVGNDENLRILKKPAASPEAIPLIAIDLVERFADRHAAPLQFHMHQREAVHKDGHIVAVIVPCAVRRAHFILVDNLQSVVVDILFVDQRNVFAASIVAGQHLHIVFLYLAGLFGDVLIGVGNRARKEALPFVIGKMVVVQLFQPLPQVVHQIHFRVNGQIGIALFAQHTDELLFQRRFALVGFGALGLRLIGGDNGVFVGFGDDVEVGHGNTSCFLCHRLEGQQLIAVILILLLPCGDFGGKTVGDVVAERVKAVKDGDDEVLFGNRRNWNAD